MSVCKVHIIKFVVFLVSLTYLSFFLKSDVTDTTDFTIQVLQPDVSLITKK